LSSYVPHDLIHSRLASHGDLAQVADDLMTAALDHGGHDNVTVLILDVS
jgi:serine/threonine protein phosphatase PrpC